MIKKKVCLVGSFGVGKTSLVSRLVEGIFSEKYLSTIGVKIDKKIVSIPAGDVLLMLWDMAGEEKFERLEASYLRGASGLIYVADGTRAETLDRAIEYAGRVAEIEPGAKAVVLLNKFDLSDEWELGDDVKIGEAVDGLPFYKTSAKSGESVEEAFAGLCELMLGGVDG